MLGVKLGYATLCLTVLLVICVIKIFRSSRKVAKQLAHLPGPPPLPFLGNALSFIKNNLDIMKTLTEIASNYDGFALLWLGNKPVVIITDPDHLQIYYTSTKNIDRPDLYNDLADAVGRDSLFTANGEMWKSKRKMFMSTFHIVPMESIIKNLTLALPKILNNFKKMSESGCVFQALYPLQKASAYGVFANAFAIDLSDETVEWILKRAKYITEVIMTRQVSPLLMNDFIFKLTSTGQKFRKYISEVQAFVEDAALTMKEEFKKLKENGEIIPNNYTYNMFQKYPDETYESFRNEAMTMAFAAMDTSSGTMGFILISLALFPEIQEKVYQEDQQIQKMLNGRTPDFQDLQKYEYLDRVIKETLRLFTAAPLIGRKLGEDTYFGKHLVPKGTDVTLLDSFRNPQIFPDPLKFDPDRFLPELVAKRHPYAYNPFSAGPRSCPGNRYAMTFLKTTVPAIIRSFKIKSHYKDFTEVLDNAIAKFTLTDKQDYPIIMEPRNHITM